MILSDATPEWASLLLANLQAQAVAFKEKLQRSKWEVQRREAELRAASGEAAQRWEQERERIHRRYEVLVAKGLSHRDAIRQIKKETHGALTATVIQSVVEGADPRKKRARRERDERIRRKAEHLTPKEIATQEGMTVDQVRWILRKGRPQTKTYSQAELAERREESDLILALHAKGKKPREIIALLGAKPQRVYDCLRYARRERRKHDGKTSSGPAN